MHPTNLSPLGLLVVVYSLSERALAQVNLGTAAPFGIIASSAITNTGATVVDAELGIYPNDESSVTGFPPGLSGDVHAGDAVANQAQQDAQTAYDAAASQASTSQIIQDLGSQTLIAGTYTASSSAGITGTLTLDGQNNPDALFVFQIGSTLTTATSSSVELINGAQACNVFWQVGSSATLGTSSVFAGNILALTSISLDEGVTVTGGLYALNGAVTLTDAQILPLQNCAVQPSATTSSILVTATSVLSSSISTSQDIVTATTTLGTATTTTFSHTPSTFSYQPLTSTKPSPKPWKSYPNPWIISYKPWNFSPKIWSFSNKPWKFYNKPGTFSNKPWKSPPKP
ncbi:hypothetical protein N0V90_000036 [Kalmusia sp. IMI 367209]|nr:hypothetical protein N0V90_000036 [Kalmusia sp. IMI 367209]